MNAQMFMNWNSIVTDNDLVIHLGDISANLKYNMESLKWIIQNLKGKKILIKGNHDHQSDEFYKECGFLVVKEYLEIGDYFLCHYPLYTKSKYTDKHDSELLEVFDKSKCTKIIHGHTHNNFSDKPSPEWPDSIWRFNCSVEVINYTPHLFNFKD